MWTRSPSSPAPTAASCPRRTTPGRSAPRSCSNKEAGASAANEEPTTTWFGMSAHERRHNAGVERDAAIGVVGATGAVGPVTLRLLRERGYENVRAFASARSVGRDVEGFIVEEATPEALSDGDLDFCLFSIGTAASRDLRSEERRVGKECRFRWSSYRENNER